MSTWVIVVGQGVCPVIPLDCPACKRPHEDRGEFSAVVHISHFCEHCGYVWDINPPVFGMERK